MVQGGMKTAFRISLLRGDYPDDPNFCLTRELAT
jgi:hypothetical protein